MSRERSDKNISPMPPHIETLGIGHTIENIATFVGSLIISPRQVIEQMLAAVGAEPHPNDKK